MERNQSFVTRKELDSAVTQHVIGFSVLGIILLLVILLSVLILWFLIKKIKELHERITELETKLYQYEENNRPDTYIRPTEFDRDTCTERYTRAWRTKSRFSSIIDRVKMRRRASENKSQISDSCEVIELKIEKEVAAVYGRKPPMSQILMSAQSFYKEQTKGNQDCPVECIEILDRQSNTRLARSTVFSGDWMEGTPTSILINGSAQNFQDVFSHNQGIFKHRKIGPKGCTMSVSGVRLEIPAGALSEERLISIGVTWDKNYMPTLSSKQALLSPVVLCQPSNVVFNVPIKLSFQHSAHRVHEDWIPSIIKREGDIDSGKPWTPTKEDVEILSITDTKVHLQLRHFTLYTCIGESKPGKIAAKLMHVVAFTGKLAQNAFFKPRLYVLNSYKEELADVETLENKMDASSKMTETTDLLVKDNGNDVVLEMVKMSDEWKLAGDMTESLSFELIWHACHPHCTFIAKPRTTSVSEIVCEIHTYQYGNDNNRAKLKIAKQVELGSRDTSPLSVVHEDATEELINTLVILLDPLNETATNAGDWRALAEKMGCDTARVRWLGSLKRSPTRVLLDRWRDDGNSFMELEHVMISIDRPDAAEEIRNRLGRFNQNVHEMDETENPYISLSFPHSDRKGPPSQNI